MKLSEYLKQNGMTSKEYFDMQKRKAKGKTTLTDYRKNQEISLKNKVGFDTIDSDLKSLGTTVESIYNGWQPQDTMNNTKASIVSMQERLNAYQEYAKLFGGEDVTELANGYKAILDDWDNRAATYGKFKTAEDYTKAAEREKSLPTADLNAVSTEIADLDKQIAEIKAQKQKFDSEYAASGGWAPSASNYNRPAQNQVKPYQEWQAKSSEYDKQIKDLENKKADRQAYYDDAKTTQETLATIQKETKMASDPKNMDGYNQYVANYEARAKENETSWWSKALMAAGTASENPVNQTINTVVQNKRDDKSWQLPQGDWSDDEKRVLGGYFLTDPDKAIDYVVKKNNEKAKGEQAKTEKEIQDSATSNAVGGIGHFIGSIATAPFALADYLDDVTDTVAGRPIIEESMVTPFEYSQAVSSGQTTHLNEVSGTLNENIPVIGGKGLGDVVGLGRSVLQSATSAYTLGGVGTLISYFGQGAAAGVDDALSRGATDEQALTYGLVLGAAEGVSEMIGADKLLKLGSPNEIRKILVNGFKKGGGKEFWSLVDKQGKAEALEELFSGVAGQVADNWIMQGKSNFDALTREYRALGMSAVDAQRKAWVKSVGDVAFDALSGYLSGAVHAGPQVVVSAHKQNAENKTIGKEIRGNERVTDMLNIASLSPQESDAYAAYTEYAKQGVNAENITDAQLGNLYGMAETDAVSSVLSKKATAEQKADAETTYNRLAKMKTENKEAKAAKELSQTNEEGVVTPATREMVINEQAKGMSEAEANLFRLVDDGKSNAVDYADSFNLVVAMAQNEYDQDYILEHRGVLSTAQVNSIYQSVVTNPKMAQQKRLNALIQEQGDNLEIKGTIDDSIIDYGNTGADGKVNWNSLHPNVKATIAYVSGFSTKVAGMDVRLVKNGRDYGFTGQYDRQGNTMLIDITALTERVKSADTKGRKDNARFIISTVAHEVTHWMEEKAPELYAQYDKMVMDALTSNGRTEAEVLGRRRALLEKAEAKRAKKENRKPHEITDKEVRREVIARASEDMLALSEEGKKFFESLTENEQKQFVDKIKEVIQNIKDWIKNVLSNLTSDAPEAQELRALAKDLDAISKKWDEMLRQAAKANAAMKKAGVNDKAIMESKASDTQNADIDTYTAKQYNDFGWVAVNKVLTGKELKKLYSQFAKVKLNKEYNFKNKLGEYLIPVGDKYGSYDHLVYIKGTNKHPIIRQVVEIQTPYRKNAVEIITEVMRDESTGLYYDAFETYEAYARAEIFTVHKLLDYLSYSEHKRKRAGRQDGKGPHRDDREWNNGTGVSKIRSGEVRGNNGEVSYSDIDDFNIADYTIDDLLKMPDDKFDKLYQALGLDDLFASDESSELYGGEGISIEDVSEELNTEPEKIEILIRREGLGASHIEENRTAVMTQERIDRGIKESSARFSPDYARRYITSISTKDFIDLTVLQKNMDRKAFDANVEGDSGSKMGDFDYESALRNEEQSPYLSIDRSTGRIIGHNGRHRIRALEMAGIEAVEIEIEFYDEDGSLMKYDSETIPDLAISSQFDTAIETHISNIIPLNETYRAEVESAYGEKAHDNAGVQYSDIDDEYMDAVEKGNMTAVQRLVDNAAKKAGYDRLMFHETDADNIHIFDVSRGTHGGTDSETPYGIFTKTSVKNIGLGSYQMALYVKAKNTLYVENRQEVKEKIPELVPYYDEIARIDKEYEALAEEYEDAEFDALQEWMDENPDADMDVVYPTSYIIEKKPADIDSQKYLDAHRKHLQTMDAWTREYDKLAVKCKEIITEHLRNNGYDSMYFKVDGGSRGRQTDSLILLDSNQVKSAAPVTKDDNGNVIPLSKRFDSANEDIRYSDIDELDDLNAQLKEKQNQIYSASMELRKFDAKAAEDKLYAVLQKDGASKQELDDALQEYKKWGEESGYADASAKLSALKDEEKLLRREIQKVEDRLHDELKEQIAHWSDEDVKKYVAKAVRKYHTTTRLDKASYLVTTGSMLDFSAGQGYRVKDHREISEILDLPDYAEYSDGMIAFMNMGNIRLQTYGIDVSAMPNAKQFSALRDIIFTVMRENDEFSVDFSKTDGYSAGSVTYGKGTSASKIIADIKSYFETGVVPEEQSSIRDFLYSDIDAEVDIYEVLGENKRLQKENKTIREDVDRLKERLKLERLLTHGNHFNENQLDAVAGHIRNLGNSNYSKPELINKLREVYTYIATSKEVTWDDLFARLYGIAEDVLGEARPVRSPNDYYANIYRDLRNVEISLSDGQKKYFKDMMGVDAYKAFFGKIKVSDKGIPLNSKWQEWAEKYPNEFAETNDKNQVLELLEIYETAKELKEMVEEYDVVERTRWLANEIYNQYWNVSPIRTTADKYDKQIKRLNYEHRNAMKELRDSYNERLEKQKKADRAERSRIFKKLREDHIKELKEIRQSGKERLDKYKEGAKRKTLIQSMVGTTTSLNKKLLTNSKETHIPEPLKPVVTNLINAIDFSSKRALGMWGGDMSGVPTSKDVALEKTFSKARSMADENISLTDAIRDASKMFTDGNNIFSTLTVANDLSLVALDLDLAEQIDGLLKTTAVLERKYGDNGFTLERMSLDDLRVLNAMVKSINHWATQIDKALAIKHKEGIANLGMQTIKENDALGEYKQRVDGIESVKKFFSWSNLLPINAFERMGTAAQKAFESLQDAQDKLVYNQDEIERFTAELFKGKEKAIKEWREDVRTFDLTLPNGKKKTIRMPVSYMMSLYAVAKQEDAMRHLIGVDQDGNRMNQGGGITIKGFKEKGNIKGDKKNTILAKGLIDKITGELSADQKYIADKLQEFMNEKGSDWGDSVSMALYGIKKFGIKDYFPITVTPTTIKKLNADNKNIPHFFSILNFGFTKSRNPNAKQSIEIGDIFDVFTNHMTMMAIYNAYALPIYDMVRWYNFSTTTVDGDEIGVINSLQNAFGEEATAYIEKLITDLNGQHESSRLGFINRIFKNTKIAMVGNSLSVSALQITAYPKAALLISPKYLTKSLFYIRDFGAKKGIEKAKKYSGIAMWKSKGNFDVDISKNMSTRIKHDETLRDKLIDWSLKGAEKGDELTWGMLWNASEFEIRDTRKDLKVGSDEFYEAIAKRLREIIYKTQVVDSPLTKSDIMRSPDGMAKSLTMFASELTVAYNIVSEAIVNAHLDVRKNGKQGAFKRNGKKIAKALTIYTITSAISQIFSTAIQAFRDDDDEKEIEDYLTMYLTNFALDWAIIGKLPYIKESLNYMQGYSSSRTETIWMENAIKAGKYWGKAFSGDDGAARRAIENSLKTLSDLSGIAGYNQYRDLMATLGFLGILTKEDFEEMLDEIFG